MNIFMEKNENGWKVIRQNKSDTKFLKTMRKKSKGLRDFEQQKEKRWRVT